MQGKFEKDIKQQLNDFSLEPSPQVWQDVENTLHPRHIDRGIVWWWVPLWGLLLAGGGWWILHSVQQPQKNNPSVILNKKQEKPVSTDLNTEKQEGPAKGIRPTAGYAGTKRVEHITAAETAGNLQKTKSHAAGTVHEGMGSTAMTNVAPLKKEKVTLQNETGQGGKISVNIPGISSGVTENDGLIENNNTTAIINNKATSGSQQSPVITGNKIKNKPPVEIQTGGLINTGSLTDTETKINTGIPTGTRNRLDAQIQTKPKTGTDAQSRTKPKTGTDAQSRTKSNTGNLVTEPSINKGPDQKRHPHVWLVTVGSGDLHNNQSNLFSHNQLSYLASSTNAASGGSAAYGSGAVQIPLPRDGIVLLAGVTYQQNLSKRWIVNTGLQYRYLQNKQPIGTDSLTMSGAYFSIGNAAVKTNYADWLLLPLGLNYSLNPSARNRFQLSFGGSLAWAFAEKWLVADTHNLLYSYHYASSLNNRINISLNAGLNYNCNDYFQVSLLAEQSLTPIHKISAEKFYIQQFDLQISKPLRLSSHKHPKHT